MRTYLPQLLLASALGLPASAIAGVDVHFVEPERFTDVPRFAPDRQQVLDELHEHIRQLDTRLPADHTLKLEILDIDLAGSMEFRRHHPDQVRIVRDLADWPRMHVRYTLESHGKVVESNEEWLSDLNYRRPVLTPSRDNSLPYEKKMISDWFMRTFVVR